MDVELGPLAHQAIKLPDHSYMTTRSGRSLCLRPSRLSDATLLDDLAQHLSFETRSSRWLLPLPPERVAAFWRQCLRAATTSQHTHMLLVTTTAEPPAVVAVGEIVSLPTTPSVAEIALVVRDEHQRDGVGSALCQWIGEMAHNWGLHQLQATILAQNHGIRRLLEHLAVPYTASRRRDELQITIDLPHAPSLD